MKEQFQHHVPEFYLKSWQTTVATVPKRIWIYRKDRPTRNSAISASAGRPNMYATIKPDGSIDIERVERYLGEVESRAGKILPKIFRHEAISDREKGFMALFISVMYRRGPYTLDAFVPQHLKPLLPKLRNELIEKYSNPEDEPGLRDLKLEAVDKGIKISEENVTSVTSEAILHSGPMGAFFASLPWSFFYSESEPFLTSDCPVIFNRFSGIRYLQNCNILFPLSRKMLLLISPLMPRPGTFTKIPAPIIQDINCRIMWNAFREVYADHRSEWMEQYVKEHIGKGLPRETE